MLDTKQLTHLKQLEAESIQGTSKNRVKLQIIL